MNSPTRSKVTKMISVSRSSKLTLLISKAFGVNETAFPARQERVGTCKPRPGFVQSEVAIRMTVNRCTFNN
jgi:hypothetical protein